MSAREIDTQGKLLIAPPTLPDWRFKKSVVYMWKHDIAGASGVIINKKCNNPSFEHICHEGGLTKRDPRVNPPIWYGGPVLTNILGVLHTLDFTIKSTNLIKKDLGFTLDRKMLEVIAQGGGPKQYIITLGLANWEPGQLENELDGIHPKSPAFSWLTLDYEPSLIFGPKTNDFWDSCVSKSIENKTKEITNKIFKN
jgi:putative transcriptional regulator